MIEIRVIKVIQIKH